MGSVPGSIVTYCRKSVLVAPSGYEPCSGADVTQFILNVLSMISQLA